MRFAPFTCSSIAVATDCSTVSASAPVYVAVVWIWRGAISGNCAIGRRKIITAPPIIVRMASTCAMMGRSMKKRDMVTSSLGPRRGRGGGGSVRLGTHDDPVPVHLLAGLHRAQGDLIVCSHHRDLVHALGLQHGALLHEERTAGGLR